MCGIVGFLDKTKNRTTVGKIVLQMLNALGARGPDSAGVALYGQKKDKGMVVQIKLGKQKEATLIVEQLEEFGSISEVKIVAEYLRLVISLEVDIASFLINLIFAIVFRPSASSQGVAQLSFSFCCFLLHFLCCCAIIFNLCVFV